MVICISNNKVFRFKIHIEPKSMPRPRFKGKRAYMPKKYKEWQKEFTKQIVEEWNNSMKRNKNPYDTQFYLFLRVYCSDGRYGDVDNQMKSVLDSLKPEIIVDDKWCEGVYMTRFLDCHEGMIEGRIVTVKRWNDFHDTTRQRWRKWILLD